MIELVAPSWLYPNNIGDSVVTTFIPPLLRKVYGTDVTVVADQNIRDILKDPSRAPTAAELSTPLSDYKQAALSTQSQYSDTKTVYPAWHPLLFKFWKQYSRKLFDHPTANILTTNYLLQLGLEEEVFSDFDFTPLLRPVKTRQPGDRFKLVLVPATKLAGRPSPHPGCNGVGLRYKLDSWKILAERITAALGDLVTIEYLAEEPLGIDGTYVPPIKGLSNIVDYCWSSDLGIMSDGGIHNVFNFLKKPVILFTGTLVNKAEFFKLQTAFYPDHLHLPCRFKCRSYYTEVFGGVSQSDRCNLECENLDPVALADYSIEVIRKLL